MAANKEPSDEQVFAAAEAACNLLQHTENYESHAVTWCAHKIDGYDPELFEGDRRTGSFLVDDYWEFVWYTASKLWPAYQECRRIYEDTPSVVECLRLATMTSADAMMNFRRITDYDQSCFEAVRWYAHYVVQFLPDKDKQPGDGKFFDATGPGGLPFSADSIRERMPDLLRNHVEFFGLRPDYDRRARSTTGPPPWLQIVKEAQRATGKVPPFVRKVGANDPGRPRSLSHLKKHTQDAIQLFRQGVGVDGVCQRLGLTAENARTIRSRYSNLISGS